MLSVDSIERGVVIDHIKTTKSMEIYDLLNLDKLDCGVCILKNVKTNKHNGKKDIIKIENNIDMDLDVLGFIDPNITVNIIDGGVITKKMQLKLPKSVKNVVKCKNPRCVTSIEPEIDHEFKLVDDGVYRCVYCEQKLGQDNRA